MKNYKKIQVSEEQFVSMISDMVMESLDRMMQEGFLDIAGKVAGFFGNTFSNAKKALWDDPAAQSNSIIANAYRSDDEKKKINDQLVSDYNNATPDKQKQVKDILSNR